MRVGERRKGESEIITSRDLKRDSVKEREREKERRESH